MKVFAAGQVQQMLPTPSYEVDHKPKRKPRVVEPVNKTKKTGLELKKRKIDVTA